MFLKHPFVLQGSSPELLSPLVSHCLTALIAKKTQDLTERVLHISSFSY